MVKLLILLFISTVAFAGQHKVLSLRNAQVRSFEELFLPKTVVIVFQAQCSSCRKQIQNLSCLKEQRYKVILLGAFSTEQDLRLEHLKYHGDYDAFLATAEVLNEFKITKAITPQIIKIDGEKKISHSLGLKSCQDILRMENLAKKI